MVIRKPATVDDAVCSTVETACVMVLAVIARIRRFRVFPALHGLELAQQRRPGRLPLRHRQQHQYHDQSPTCKRP